MCIFYSPDVARQCREDDAEEVKEKERANFCDYFKPGTDVYDGKLAAAENKARGEFAALFGDESVEGNDDKPDNDLTDADKLFK